MTFLHGEAFMLMNYRCEQGHRLEIWNSRDGVTPFSMTCPKCGESMTHEDWFLDRQVPGHRLKHGDPFFRDGTPDEAEQIMRSRIERAKNRPGGDPHLTPEYEAELVQSARNGDSEFRPGWPRLDFKGSRPCRECGRPHMHRNSFCSPQCCKTHRGKEAPR